MLSFKDKHEGIWQNVQEHYFIFCFKNIISHLTYLSSQICSPAFQYVED